ncbi:MbnP family protein [Dyadobacter sp. 32]|uniref:MbnP family protein n=1 Tax=Dyadobacter sp. 32 TaxID=538966 RepID=UPI0011EE6374
MKNIFSRVATLVPAAFCLFALISCSDSTDNSEPVPVTEGKLRIEFDNVVGDKNLVLNSVSYLNATKEDFIVTKFNYFISNIKLTKADGTVFTVPQDSSYFLIKEDTKATQFVTLNNVPSGDYKAVEFMVGIDSLRNTAPIEKRKGVLDPGGSMLEDGMYWSWNSGYIFLKLEGTSPKGNPVNNKFYYHIGLFGGYKDRTVNNTRVVNVGFGSIKATVTETAMPEIHLLVDVQKVFDGPGANISIEKYNSIMGGQPERSQDIANNYAKMFTLDHIH